MFLLFLLFLPRCNYVKIKTGPIRARCLSSSVSGRKRQISFAIKCMSKFEATCRDLSRRHTAFRTRRVGHRNKSQPLIRAFAYGDEMLCTLALLLKPYLTNLAVDARLFSPLLKSEQASRRFVKTMRRMCRVRSEEQTISPS